MKIKATIPGVGKVRIVAIMADEDAASVRAVWIAKDGRSGGSLISQVKVTDRRYVSKKVNR